MFGDCATELLSCPDEVVEVLEQRKYLCWKCGLGVRSAKIADRGGDREE